jgi:RHS repeat-associated protein
MSTACQSTRNLQSYMRARYYDPSTAQFLSRDPAFALTREPYAYAHDNPVNNIDPSGLCDWWDLGCHANEAKQWASRNTQLLASTARIADFTAELASTTAVFCAVAAGVSAPTGVGAVVFGGCAAFATGVAIGATLSAAALHGLAAWGTSDAQQRHDEALAGTIDAVSLPLEFVTTGLLRECTPQLNGTARDIYNQLRETGADQLTGIVTKLQRHAAGLQ